MADIQATLLKMSEQLGRLEQGMKTLSEEMHALRKEHKIQGDRIGTLERWRVKIATIGAIVGSGATMAVSWFIKKFGM